MKSLTVIGLNSGTSTDGIDAAIFRIERKTAENLTISKKNFQTSEQPPQLKIEMINGLVYEIDPHFKNNLQKLVASGYAKLDEVCRLNSAIGEIFASAVKQLLKKSKLSCSDIDLIGSHGQTIWHAPAKKKLWGVETTSTMQLGDPAIIALRTGIPVISDFRLHDMAVGGQGAPLVPFADEVLFGHLGKPTAVLNIGGIANITVLNELGNAIYAFDTGPGNMIIDRAAQKLLDTEFDKDGKVASSGKVDQEWLCNLFSHPYFKLSPPKSTGREEFGYSYADKLIDNGLAKNLSKQDILATLTMLTAASIAAAYKTLVAPKIHIDHLILGGGGAENQTIQKMLIDSWPHSLTLKKHEDYGISTKFKEALLFALLAYTSYFRIPNNCPKCTGASHKVCLGKLCMP